MMRRNPEFILGAVSAATVFLLIYLAFGKQEPAIIETILTDTVTVVEVKTDTIFMTIVDSIYVKEYVPVIDSTTAKLDTVIEVKEQLPEREDSLVLGVHLALSFDLIDTVFRDITLGFPLIQIPIDTVFMETRIHKTITIRVPPSKWKYLEAGVIGGALALCAYALAQGL